MKGRRIIHRIIWKGDEERGTCKGGTEGGGFKVIWVRGKYKKNGGEAIWELGYKSEYEEISRPKGE